MVNWGYCNPYEWSYKLYQPIYSILQLLTWAVVFIFQIKPNKNPKALQVSSWQRGRHRTNGCIL